MRPRSILVRRHGSTFVRRARSIVAWLHGTNTTGRPGSVRHGRRFGARLVVGVGFAFPDAATVPVDRRYPGHFEPRAARLAVGRGDVPPVGLDELVDDGQAQAGPLLVGGVAGLEDGVEVFLGDRPDRPEDPPVDSGTPRWTFAEVLS